MSLIKNAQLRYRVIDRMLRNQYDPYPSKEDLRQACEEAIFGSSHGEHISDSTIEKDLFALRTDHDAPVKYSKIHKGYYYEDPNYSMDNIPLSEDDVEAIRFAATTLFQFKGVDIFRQFGSAIDKILERTAIPSAMESQEVDQFVQFESVPHAEGVDLLGDLLGAIKEKQKVSFFYQRFNSPEGKDRLVHPHLLKQYRNRWYLIAFDPNKEKIITYGLDRIRDLKVLEEEYFLIDEGFNPDLYFKHSIGITTTEDPPKNVVISLSPVLGKYIKSQPLHESQTILKDNNKECRVQLHVQPTEELKMLILSYGPDAKVLKPKSLVEEIADKVKQMHKGYKE